MFYSLKPVIYRPIFKNYKIFLRHLLLLYLHYFLKIQKRFYDIVGQGVLDLYFIPNLVNYFIWGRV